MTMSAPISVRGFNARLPTDDDSDDSRKLRRTAKTAYDAASSGAQRGSCRSTTSPSTRRPRPASIARWVARRAPSARWRSSPASSRVEGCASPSCSTRSRRARPGWIPGSRWSSGRSTRGRGGSSCGSRPGARSGRCVRRTGEAVVVRSGTPVVGLVALYCRLWRRKLVFSSANDLDFLDQWSRRTRIYGFGVRSADAVVVQSEAQVDLARRRFPQIRKLVRIPSFADQPASVDGAGQPRAFYWVGRLVDYKRPLLYAELAEAVPEARFVLIPLLPPLSDYERDAYAQLEEAAERLPNLELRDEPSARRAGRGARRRSRARQHLHPRGDAEHLPRGLGAGSAGADVLVRPGRRRRRAGSRRRRGRLVGALRRGRARAVGRLVSTGRSSRTTARDYVRETHSAESVGARWHALLESIGDRRHNPSESGPSGMNGEDGDGTRGR